MQGSMSALGNTSLCLLSERKHLHRRTHLQVHKSCLRVTVENRFSFSCFILGFLNVFISESERCKFGGEDCLLKRKEFIHKLTILQNEVT